MQSLRGGRPGVGADADRRSLAGNGSLGGNGEQRWKSWNVRLRRLDSKLHSGGSFSCCFDLCVCVCYCYCFS